MRGFGDVETMAENLDIQNEFRHGIFRISMRGIRSLIFPPIPPKKILRTSMSLHAVVLTGGDEGPM